MKNIRPIGYIISIIIYISATYTINHKVSQHDFIWILWSYTLAFGSYAILLTLERPKHQHLLIILMPLISLNTLPRLSDDFYRFIWDGELWQMGLNAFKYLPSDVIETWSNGDFKILYDEMNSPHYHTVYPMVLQFLFFLAASLGTSLASKVVVLKISYFLIHLLGYYYFRKLLPKLKYQINGLLYFLNPLVIIEGIGNLHPEILMISFIIMALYYFDKITWASALFYSFAIAVKILPLFFIPFIFFQLEKEKRSVFLSYTILFCSILFLPLVVAIPQFLASIDLYFQKFEFNGSLYYVLRYVGKILTGYNQIAVIGPLLGLIAAGAMLKKAYKRQHLSYLSFSQYALFALTIYFLCSSIVHPWYVISLIFFAMMTRVVSIIFWSFLITMTYINYSYEIYKEHYYIIFLEYSIFLMIFWIKDKEKIVPIN